VESGRECHPKGGDDLATQEYDVGYAPPDAVGRGGVVPAASSRRPRGRAPPASVAQRARAPLRALGDEVYMSVDRPQQQSRVPVVEQPTIRGHRATTKPELVTSEEWFARIATAPLSSRSPMLAAARAAVGLRLVPVRLVQGRAGAEREQTPAGPDLTPPPDQTLESGSGQIVRMSRF
jgi:hypothetical protein